MPSAAYFLSLLRRSQVLNRKSLLPLGLVLSVAGPYLSHSPLSAWDSLCSFLTPSSPTGADVGVTAQVPDSYGGSTTRSYGSGDSYSTGSKGQSGSSGSGSYYGGSGSKSDSNSSSTYGSSNNSSSNNDSSNYGSSNTDTDTSSYKNRSDSYSSGSNSYSNDSKSYSSESKPYSSGSKPYSSGSNSYSGGSKSYSGGSNSYSGDSSSSTSGSTNGYSSSGYSSDASETSSTRVPQSQPVFAEKAREQLRRSHQPPVYRLEDVLRFDVSTTWVTSRWPRISAGLAELDLHGYRVPLVTGTEEQDLAGSLTYYFNKQQEVEKITFHGGTGDPRKLVALLTSQFKFEREVTNDPSLVLYGVKWNGKDRSELRIHQARVVRADSPHSRYEIDLAIRKR